MEVAHAVENVVLLGQVVGELRQRLGRPDTNAHRQARPLLDAVTHLLPHGNGTTIKVGDHLDAQEGLVDAVDLQVRRIVAQDAGHPVAHVAIQRIVR